MKLTRSLGWAFVAGVVLALAADALLIATGSQKAELWASSLPGYWAALGFLAFLIIVGVSKLLGDLLISRPEDYYDREEEGPDDV